MTAAPNLRKVAAAVQETVNEMRLNAVSLPGLIGMDLPERTMLLSPWLPSSGLAMVYAPTNPYA